MWLSEILILAAFVQGPDTGTYPKYETEDISVYRQRVVFEYPAIDPGQPPVKNEYHPQENVSETPLTWELPPAVDAMLTRAREEGAAATTIDGFRVQIYAGGDLEEANKVKADFLEAFPGHTAYRLWIQPTFRVRVGDFATRNEATVFAQEIKKIFPGAFIVPDKVTKPRVRKPVTPSEEGEQIPTEEPTEQR